MDTCCIYLGSGPYKEDYQVSRISRKGCQGHLPSPLAKFSSVSTLKIFRVVSSNELHAKIARPLSATEQNMLYNMCHVMLYNMSHVMLYNMGHVMLYNMGHVMLYNMCHVMLYNIKYVMLCYDI